MKIKMPIPQKMAFMLHLDETWHDCSLKVAATTFDQSRLTTVLFVAGIRSSESQQFGKKWL